MNMMTSGIQAAPILRFGWARGVFRFQGLPRRPFLAVLFALVLWSASASAVLAQKPLAPEPVPELALPYSLRVQEPTPDRVFQVESEEALVARLRRENPKLADRIYFPKIALPVASLEVRSWPPQPALVEPNFVCYRPLYFEDKNTERYGWDFSIFQPIVSTGKFYLDLVTLPYQMGAHPPCCCECNSGYFLPGDPVPYMLYVPPPSLTGIAAQTGVIVGGVAIFP